MNELTIEDKKRLTEFLEEKYEPTVQDIVEGEFFESRTFTTWQDLGDCKKALVKEGKWERFYSFVFYAYKKNRREELWRNTSEARIADWLFNPIRFCRLVAEFMEAQNGKE